MSDAIRFTLDGREVTARPGETIWEVARREGTTHPASLPQARGRATAPTATAAPAWSRSRASARSSPPASAHPTEGMEVRTETARARTARRLVIELLAADQPPRDVSPDRSSHFWDMADGARAWTGSRFPPERRAAARRSATPRWR